MKKTVALAVAGLSLLGAAGQASANIAQNHLTQVMYNKDFNQVYVDLGLIGTDFSMTDKNKVLAAAGTVDFGMAGVSSWSALSLSAYATNTNLDIDNGGWGYSQYVGTNNPNVPAFNPSGQDSFDQGVEFINGHLAAGTVAVAPILGDATGYYKTFNNSGKNTGTFAVSLDTNFGESNLAALDAGGYVDMYIYHFGTDLESFFATGDYSYVHMLLPNADASSYAVLRLNADGSTILNPTSSSEVPLPGTMLLFGSSLLGLFGIRRKEA